jgi:hypothetical protein
MVCCGEENGEKYMFCHLARLVFNTCWRWFNLFVRVERFVRIEWFVQVCSGLSGLDGSVGLYGDLYCGWMC